MLVGGLAHVEGGVLGMDLPPRLVPVGTLPGKGYIRAMVSPPPPTGAIDARQQELDEAEEDRLDAEAARIALAEFKASGEKSIPLADVKKHLGIE
jgi:hypothetical protein